MRFLMILCVTFALYSTVKAEQSALIPFIYDQPLSFDKNKSFTDEHTNNTKVKQSDSHGYSKKQESPTTRIANIETVKLKSLVEDVRNSICNGIKKGNIKLWIAFDANAKVLGVGTSSNGGIEILINCN